MTDYQHLLLATDLTESSKTVAKKAVSLARHFKAKLSLIHVVDYTPSYGYLYVADVSDDLVKRAKTELCNWGKEFEIPESDQIVEMGSIKNEVLGVAADRQADLILVGSHGPHGLAKLLGSTASAIVNSAECDTLVIRSED